MTAPNRRATIREAFRWGFVELPGKRKHRILVHPELPGVRMTFSHGANSNASAKHAQHKILCSAIEVLRAKQEKS